MRRFDDREELFERRLLATGAIEEEVRDVELKGLRSPVFEFALQVIEGASSILEVGSRSFHLFDEIPAPITARINPCRTSGSQIFRISAVFAARGSMSPTSTFHFADRLPNWSM